MGPNGEVHHSTSARCTQKHLVGQPACVITSHKVLRCRLAEPLIPVSSRTGRLHLPRCFIGSIIVLIWPLSSLSEAVVRYLDQHDYLYLHSSGCTTIFSGLSYSRSRSNITYIILKSNFKL